MAVGKKSWAAALFTAGAVAARITGVGAHWAVWNSGALPDWQCGQVDSSCSGALFSSQA